MTIDDIIKAIVQAILVAYFIWRLEACHLGKNGAVSGLASTKLGSIVPFGTLFLMSRLIFSFWMLFGHSHGSDSPVRIPQGTTPVCPRCRSRVLCPVPSVCG
jgi:hypothetical protein